MDGIRSRLCPANADRDAMRVGTTIISEGLPREPRIIRHGIWSDLQVELGSSLGSPQHPTLDTPTTKAGK